MLEIYGVVNFPSITFIKIFAHDSTSEEVQYAYVACHYDSDGVVIPYQIVLSASSCKANKLTIIEIFQLWYFSFPLLAESMRQQEKGVASSVQAQTQSYMMS